MTNEQFYMAKMGALLSTLHEVDGAPEIIVQLGLQLDIDQYLILKTLLLRAELVAIRSNTMYLTDKGIVLAAQCYAAGQELKTADNARGVTP